MGTINLSGSWLFNKKGANCKCLFNVMGYKKYQKQTFALPILVQYVYQFIWCWKLNFVSLVQQTFSLFNYYDILFFRTEAENKKTSETVRHLTKHENLYINIICFVSAFRLTLFFMGFLMEVRFREGGIKLSPSLPPTLVKMWNTQSNEINFCLDLKYH